MNDRTTRRPAASSAAPRAVKTAPRSAFFRGAAGMQRTDEELAHAKQKADERRAAGGNPFRFRVAVGETKQIIIVDDKPDFFMYEHALKDSEGNWGKLFTGCVKTFDNCPVCQEQGKESYYAMVLTCIDLTPFKTRDGTEVDFSRKLLIVKPAQQKKFLRFYAKEGTLRGALFDMTRDGDKDSSIGSDIDFVEFVPEEEMETYVRTYKDRDGKKIVDKCDEPYEYEKLFEEPDTEKLRALVGGKPAPGSKASNDRELGGTSSRRTPSRTPTRTAKPAAKDDDWDDPADGSDFDADVPEEPAPRSARRAPAVAPRGRAAPEPEADEPPARPTRAKAPAATTRSRPATTPARPRPSHVDDDDIPY